MRQHKITPENLWNCDGKGIIMGLVVGRQKAIVRASTNSRNKVILTDGNGEFSSSLETISAEGHVIPPFVVWANKVHCDGWYTTGDTRPGTFSRSHSGYMDDDLGLDYISKHFDPYTAPPRAEGPIWHMFIVDGHSSHVAYPVVEYGLDHNIVIYCLPPHTTHLMQPLDVACFAPLSRAHRTALQDFIYDNPGKPFGKPEFWDSLCIAREQALIKDNILGGYEATGIWPLRPEEVLDRVTAAEVFSNLPSSLSTPVKLASMRSALANSATTPHSRAIVDEGIINHLVKRIIQYWVIDPACHGLKQLRNGRKVKLRSTKHIQGPRSLNRDYIESEKARTMLRLLRRIRLPTEKYGSWLKNKRKRK